MPLRAPRAGCAQAATAGSNDRPGLKLDQVHVVHHRGHIVATIFAFTVSWGAFLYPLADLHTSDQMVLTGGIVSDLIRGDVFQWGKIMAGCVLAAAPPIVIYAFLMDYYIAGLTAGATKG